MDVTNHRRCLGLLAGGLLAGTAGAVGWSLSDIHVEASSNSAVKPETQTPLVNVDVDQPSSSIDFQPLRRPLYDPPPPKPKVKPSPPPAPVVNKPPPPTAAPRLEITLVGTIIEANNSLAIVADAAGEFDVKGEGQSLELSPEGITVAKIESERVTVRYKGKESTIELDRSQVKGAGRRARDRGGNDRGGKGARNNR